MLRRDHVPVRDYRAPDHELDALALRLRRLVLHRGYDHRRLGSPLLARLMPRRRMRGGPAAEIALLRGRLADEGLDRNAVAYLIETVETELDLARQRLA